MKLNKKTRVVQKFLTLIRYKLEALKFFCRVTLLLKPYYLLCVWYTLKSFQDNRLQLSYQLLHLEE